MLTYITKGTCSRQILFNVTEDDKVVDVKGRADKFRKKHNLEGK